jgi:transposase-like protein
MRRPRAAGPNVERSAFAGFRIPPEVITLAVRWYLRYGLSYRDVEELLGERGVEVDHVTVYRWVQRFTPLFADAARPLRHACGDRWFVDETYVKVAGRWRYLYRAVDQYGQVIDLMVSERRDTAAARRFFTAALRYGPVPVEVTTDKAGPYLRVLDDLNPRRRTRDRAIRQQPDRKRSRPVEGSPAADARTQTPPVGYPDRRRPRLRAEPAPRPLRTRHRGPTAAPPGHRIHRARTSHVTGAPSTPDALPPEAGRNRPGWKEPVEFMHHCSTKWATYLMSLKSLVETGEGRPSPRDVHVAFPD